MSRLWPWLVCFFLVFATLLSYLDRQALSVIAPLILREFHIDNARLGLLLSAFFYSYAIMHLVNGWILDRYNIRFVYAAFVGLWSLAQIACGFTRSFSGLFASRLALGGFEAAGQTGAARIISRILPARDRALANGIMMSGGSLGAAIAPIGMIWMANTVGWRAGFLALGALGLVWTLVWILWFRPPREVVAGTADPAYVLGKQDQWPVILRNPRFWACVAGAAFGVPIIHVASAWIPTYFVQEWKLSLGAGLSTALFLIYLGLDAGFLLGGALVSWLIRGGFSVAHARKLVFVGSAVFMLAAALAPLARNVASAVALTIALNAGRASWGAIFLAYNQDIAPGRVAMIASIMGSIGAFAGAILVWLVGLISQYKGFHIPFLMIGALAVLGSVPPALVRWQDSNACTE